MLYLDIAMDNSSENSGIKELLGFGGRYTAINRVGCFLLVVNAMYSKDKKSPKRIEEQV